MIISMDNDFIYTLDRPVLEKEKPIHLLTIYIDYVTCNIPECILIVILPENI